jgi:hypothetical protein
MCARQPGYPAHISSVVMPGSPFTCGCPAGQMRFQVAVNEQDEDLTDAVTGKLIDAARAKAADRRNRPM